MQGDHGGWWAELLLCTQPTSHDSDWNDCALLCMGFHWSGFVTHGLNRKKQVQTSLKLITRVTVRRKKTVQRPPNCSPVKGLLKINEQKLIYRALEMPPVRSQNEGTSAEQLKWGATRKYTFIWLLHMYTEKHQVFWSFWGKIKCWGCLNLHFFVFCDSEVCGSAATKSFCLTISQAG